MKMLVIYASKSRTSAECAEDFASMFNNLEVEVVDIAVKSPKIEEFDIIVIGSGVRMGRIPKHLSKFITQNKEVLLTKRIAFFLCTGSPERFDFYLENNIPEELRTVAVAFGNFGGSLDLARFHGFERILVRMMRSSINNEEESDDELENRAMPAIIPENISRFANDIKRTIKE